MGIALWFNSSDHAPPHFHAEKAGEWAVRVRFLRPPEQMFEVMFSFKRGRPRPADLRELGELAERHRSELLEEWQCKVNMMAPGPGR
jgi:hypothetical protein